ncbi:MAG: hypothetical protein ACI4Q3_05355 [Kiritimatiellia bacterium]
MMNFTCSAKIAGMACAGLVSFCALAAEPRADAVVAETLDGAAKIGAVRPGAAPCGGGVCAMPTGAAFLSGTCATAKERAATGPFFAGDIHDVIERAGRDGKRVVMSLGRAACPRCLKFYRLVEEGRLEFDPAKCVYVKLLVDDVDQRETFLSFCDPDGDNRLPYLGVYDPASGEASTRAAGGTLEECRSFFGDVLRK